MPRRSAKTNLMSALDHPEIVSAYIEEELGQRNISLVGRLEDAKHLDIHISPLGAIPKKGRPGKWRLIMDLSSPKGLSINDGIAKEDCSFHYASVDWAVQRIVQLGQHTLLAKMDIRKAYRNIPIAPTDRHLLGFTWDEKVYVDKVLPFGLRSAPLIFSATADALLWIMYKRGVSYIRRLRGQPPQSQQNYYNS